VAFTLIPINQFTDGVEENMALKRNILVIDDEADVCETLGDMLSLKFDVQKAHDITSAKAQIQKSLPDLVIVDVKLNQESGLDLCSSLRSNAATKHIPVVVFSGSQDQNQVVTAFENGADDYIPKTTRPKEFIARVLARIRRVEETHEDPSVLVCGNLSMNLEKLEVSINDHPIPFSVLEFNLLKFFIQNKERVVSRQQILAGVWQGSVVSNRTIDTHMVYIRKKLKGFDYSFATVYGAGYILRRGIGPLSTVHN